MALKEQTMDRAADLAAVTSGASAVTAWFADIEPIIAAVAGLVAIVAGGFAAWYHFEKAMQVRKQRLGK